MLSSTIGLLALILLSVWIASNYVVVRFCSKQLSVIKQGDRIAVIGNGPSVMSEKLGAFIDKHDVVVRFNAAPVFPEHTGTKTTVHALTAGSNKPFAKGAERVIVLNSKVFEFVRCKLGRGCLILHAGRGRPTTGMVVLRHLSAAYPRNQINIIGFDGIDTKRTFSETHFFSVNDAARTLLDKMLTSVGHHYHSNERDGFERLLGQNPNMSVMHSDRLAEVP